jgi:hypothetical protein
MGLRTLCFRERPLAIHVNDPGLAEDTAAFPPSATVCTREIRLCAVTILVVLMTPHRCEYDDLRMRGH